MKKFLSSSYPLLKPIHLERYFKRCWKAELEVKQQIADNIQHFYYAVAALKAQDKLGLKLADLEFWKEIAPIQKVIGGSVSPK